MELAELLLRLTEQKNPDAQRILDDFEKGTITLPGALEKLSQLHRRV